MASRSQSPRNAPRAPAASRRGRGGSRLRSDRDGDLIMDASKGRGRIGKSTATPPPTPSRDLMSRASRGPSRGSRSLLSEKSRSAIATHVASNDTAMREVRTSAPRSGLAEIKVTGWEKSKASGDADGGVSSLIKWMEKKASHKLGSRTKEVKIKKSRVEGSTLIISVASEDAGSLLRMNGWVWAGTSINIERFGGDTQGSASSTQEKEDTKAMLKGVLERRYNFDSKFLDLSNLGQDEGLLSKNVFDQKSTTSKIFPALMRVLELAFDTPEEKDAAVTSVSLANNDLSDVSYVTTLSVTLPKLHNLDLSNNKIDKLKALDPWRRRFYQLQHLILSGNPIEQAEPEYPAEIMKWYPNLRVLNTTQVRTEEEVAKKLTVTDLPFPIRSPQFQDQEGIAENFIRTFFTGFDTDRAALAAHYYDEQSTFSYAVNTQAPRDPAASETTEKQEWDHYIRGSRNLKKISQLPARQSRLYHGTKAVGDAFAAMPKTKHPDLATEAKKWMIEAHIQPGIPDPANQNPGGVDGFMITIHGQFEEIESKKRRSFDRTFMIGPGGPGGVRIVNDVLTVRAYGGAQAFDPDHFEAWNATETVQAIDPTVPQLPVGITIEIAEQMVAEMQKQTGMNVQYAKDCLEASGWNFEQGLATFNNLKGNLGPEAFA